MQNAVIEALRREFEPLKISPEGIHAGWAMLTCAQGWEQDRTSPAELARQIGDSATWLARHEKTAQPNWRAGSSYGLKARVEEWNRARRKGENPYVCQGAFLMAAHRAGFTIQAIRKMSFVAFINISNKRLGLYETAEE